jgi:diacylglycerol diphosphate phosphatase/phosphatidate phosphatase
MDYRRWCSSIHLLPYSTLSVFKSTDHWHDIVVGSAVGLLLSYFSYRQYYPSLGSPLSHRPYAPRIESEEESGLPMHNDPHSNDPGDHSSADGVDDVELGDGTVKRSGLHHLEDGWREEGSNQTHS